MSGFLKSLFGLADSEHPHPNGSKVEDTHPNPPFGKPTAVGSAIAHMTPLGKAIDAMNAATKKR